MIKTILNVTYDDEKDKYGVACDQGTSYAEAIFAMAVTIKSFVKNKIITKNEDATILLVKYLTDPQYEEVKENDSTS